LCIVNRITAENEQLLDAPVVYVRGKLRHVYRVRILRNLPDQQRLADILQRGVDGINEQLYCERVIGAGQHQTCPWLCEKIIRRLAKPLRIKARSAYRSVYTFDNYNVTDNGC